jgi:hypothetical protein
MTARIPENVSTDWTLTPRAMPGLVTYLALQIQYCASQGEQFCTAIVGQ